MRPGIPLAAALIVLSLLAGSGCGSAATAPASESHGAASVTLTNAFETTDYPLNPQRVVVTASAVDNVLALGITPTAVILTPQDEGAPWREGRLDDVERIEVSTYGDLDAERIAVVAPDVIIGDIWWIDSEAEYRQLADIAPTLNGPDRDPLRAGWKERLIQLGALYGLEAKAQAVIDQDGALIRRTADDLPGLRGKSGWIGREQETGVIGVSPGPRDPANSFLYELGMRLPDQIENRPANSGSGALTASAEQIDRFAADFSVLYTPRPKAEFMATPGVAGLPQVRAGTMVISDYATVIGLAQPSSLVRQWALVKLRPILEQVAAA